MQQKNSITYFDVIYAAEFQFPDSYPNGQNFGQPIFKFFFYLADTGDVKQRIALVGVYQYTLSLKSLGLHKSLVELTC